MYFAKHKLAIEVDEKRQRDRDKHREIEREKSIEKELDCKFIRFNPDDKDFHIHINIGKIYNHTNKSFEKSLIYKISKKISELNLCQIISKIKMLSKILLSL